MDILLNTETGDIEFDNTNSPLVTDSLNSDLSQRLRIKLQTYLGEWFLNSDIGVPYYQSVFTKGTSKSATDLVFQQQILSERDVIEISEFTSELNTLSRLYTLSFRVKTAEGFTDLISIGG